MDFLLAPLLSYLLLYKYVALFVVVYSVAVILPLPSNVMLLAVGAFSSQGYFSFWLSLAVAVVANTLGDLTDYVIARKYGDAVVRTLRLNKFAFFLQLEKELRTDAAITVFTTRFAGILSTPASFLAGVAKVPLGTFLWCDVLGNVIEPFVALSLGYLAGDYWTDFSGPLSLIAGIVAVGVVLFVLVRIYRRMERKYGGS
jgi:membrane protein DedA with SNARE-associated domain